MEWINKPNDFNNNIVDTNEPEISPMCTASLAGGIGVGVCLATGALCSSLCVIYID